MQKISLIILLLIGVSIRSYSQDVFFKTGVNYTSYSFKDQNGKQIKGLFPGSGSSYELGVGFPIKKDFLKYELGLSLNGYNATGGDIDNNYSWDTNYGGIKNTISFYPTFPGDLNIGILGIFGASGIISGTQVINNSRYELKNHPEFKGIFLETGLGLLLSYDVSKKGLISVSYDYTNNFGVGQNNEEKLSFNNQRILFGVHFIIN